MVAGASAGGGLAGAAHQEEAGGEVGGHALADLGGGGAVVAVLEHVEQVAGGAGVVGEGLGRAGVVVVEVERGRVAEILGAGEAFALAALGGLEPVALDPGDAVGDEAVLVAQPFALGGVGAPVLPHAHVHELGAGEGEAGAPEVDAGGGEFRWEAGLERGEEAVGLHQRGDEELAVVVGGLAVGDVARGAVHGAGGGGDELGRAVVGEQGGGGEGEVGRGVLDLGVVVGIADGAVADGVGIGLVVNLERGDGAHGGLQLVEQIGAGVVKWLPGARGEMERHFGCVVG